MDHHGKNETRGADTAIRIYLVKFGYVAGNTGGGAAAEESASGLLASSWRPITDSQQALQKIQRSQLAQSIERLDSLDSTRAENETTSVRRHQNSRTVDVKPRYRAYTGTFSCGPASGYLHIQ